VILWQILRRGLAPLLVLLALLAPRGALAHATQLGSDPADGAVLAESPARLSLAFDEPVQLLALSLLDQGGTARDLAAAATNDGQRIVVELAEALARGGYLLSWRAASLDGHVIAGTVAFSVGVAAEGPALAGANWRWPGFAFRLAARLLVLLAAGSALFLLLVARPTAPPALDRAARRLAQVALPVLLLAFGAMGAERAGLWPLGLDLSAAWSTAFAAPAAWLWAISLAALLVLASVRQPALRLGAALLAPALLAGSGHGLVAWQGVGQALMWLHGIAAAAWIGALWPLRWSLRHEPEAARVFGRFQTLGLVAVLGVVASGVALAVAILPSLATLWSSDYGLRLSAKLLLVAAMLAIAAANRLQATRAAMLRQPRAGALLSRLLALDAVVATGVVVLATGLSLDPPPAAARLSLHLHHERAAIEMTLLPGRIGDNLAELHVAGADFEPREVTLRVAAPAAGVAPVTLAAQALGDGRWSVERLPLWVAGPWEIEVGLLVDSFTIVELRDTLSLAP